MEVNHSQDAVPLNTVAQYPGHQVDTGTTGALDSNKMKFEKVVPVLQPENYQVTRRTFAVVVFNVLTLGFFERINTQRLMEAVDEKQVKHHLSYMWNPQKVMQKSNLSTLKLKKTSLSTLQVFAKMLKSDELQETIQAEISQRVHIQRNAQIQRNARLQDEQAKSPTPAGKTMRELANMNPLEYDGSGLGPNFSLESSSWTGKQKPEFKDGRYQYPHPNGGKPLSVFSSLLWREAIREKNYDLVNHLMRKDNGPSIEDISDYANNVCNDSLEGSKYWMTLDDYGELFRHVDS